jgi:hypothetical protein
VNELPILGGAERAVPPAAAGHLLAQAFTEGGRQRVDLIAWQDGSFTVTLTDLPVASVATASTQLASTLSTANDAGVPRVDEGPSPTIWPARDAEDGVRRMMEFTRRRPMPHE